MGLPHARHARAALGRDRAGLHRGHARRVLDHATHRHAAGRTAMRPACPATRMVPWGWAIAMLLVHTPFAHAHVERGQATGFVLGFGHPWSGLDHVVAML